MKEVLSMKHCIGTIVLSNNHSLNIERINNDIDDTLTFNINGGRSYTRDIIDGSYFMFKKSKYFLSNAIRVNI